MTGDSNRCLDPEVLAAFYAGNLSGAELKMVADHLRECEDCRTIVGDIAYVARSTTAEAVVAKRWPTLPWWLGAAAAALAGVVYLAVWSRGARQGRGAIGILVAATPRDGRDVEPRLSGGFPWAPLRPAQRAVGGPLDAGQMKLVGAAGDVLEKTAGDDSIEARHAAALAHLFAGRPKEAAALLGALAPRASDARIWTDLAAARLVVATGDDDPLQLAQALAAADAALRITPKFPEALFDRALILEHLGLREQAAAAWQQYLSVDKASPWAAEARQHRRELGVPTSFRRELERDYARLSADPALARALARRFPQDARVWGETEILGRWAEAWQDNRAAAAGSHLQLARAFAEELASLHGERMLGRAVAAIDSADGQQRRALAAAHIDFRAAQKTYQAGRPADAERTFADAAALFDEGHSPLAFVARYFAANTAFDQGRVAEAKATLEGLVASAPAELMAHRAQAEWELGLANAALGHWGEAMHALRDSVAVFERLGEVKYATAVREILAEVYDRIGEPSAAWHHRIIALRELGREETPRLQVAVESVVRAALLDRDWPVALSFVSIELEIVERDGEVMALVETLLLRARLEGRLGRGRDAALDLSRASTAMARLGDAAMREHAEIDRIAVAASLAPSPSDAVTLLTRAIDFHRIKGRPIYLPEMLLERGRAFNAVGRRDAAARDYACAVDELEAQRKSMDPLDRRWGVFTSAGELFDEAVALTVSRGDARGALAYAERSRARGLLDACGIATPAPPPNDGYGDAVVVEYTALPSRLVIFVIDHGHVRAVQQDIERSTLAAWAERLAESAANDDRDQFRRLGLALYSRLIAPVADSIDRAHLLVFVPDVTLSGIPFSALVDPKGHYVVERHAVVVAPSAAVYAHLIARTHRARQSPRVLVIAGAAAREGDLTRLSAARREAEAVASVYHAAATIGPNDQHSAIARRLAGADVIHFVGHAVESDGSADAALVTSSSLGSDMLNVRDIASMHLENVGVVVLAACSTARGRGGERSLSLAHAFVAAGVPSVAATLWPIADGPSAEFFPRFHQRLAERVPAAEALRSIQLEWIHRRDAPPAMWAAVEIIGS
jgi:CHAT domain-containing protein